MGTDFPLLVSSHVSIPVLMFFLIRPRCRNRDYLHITQTRRYQKSLSFSARVVNWASPVYHIQHVLSPLRWMTAEQRTENRSVCTMDSAFVHTRCSPVFGQFNMSRFQYNALSYHAPVARPYAATDTRRSREEKDYLPKRTNAQPAYSGWKCTFQALAKNMPL